MVVVGAKTMSPAVRYASLPRDMPAISLPEHEILEGAPNATCAFTAQSEDGLATAGFWSCDVGRYEFYFDYDEFIYLIEGEVVVHEPGGSRTLKKGDTAHFPNGVTTIWEVTQRMTKYFVAKSCPRS
jgi:uncharacterized cupin superfamily protein